MKHLTRVLTAFLVALLIGPTALKSTTALGAEYLLSIIACTPKTELHARNIDLDLIASTITDYGVLNEIEQDDKITINKYVRTLKETKDKEEHIAQEAAYAAEQAALIEQELINSTSNNRAIDPPQPSDITPHSNPVTYSQYVRLGNDDYPFSILPLNTQIAQDFIDTNPGSYGMWNNVTYASTFDAMFAHYYAAGKMVYDSSVGDIITLHYENGTEELYRVSTKVIASVHDYYDTNSELWKQTGLTFDLLIKTCYTVDVTDLIITLVKE